MDKCPSCGSKAGVYKTFTGTQYYRWDGEPDGFTTDDPENQTNFVRCLSCNRRISMKRILKEGEKDG